MLPKRHSFETKVSIESILQNAAKTTIEKLTAGKHKLKKISLQSYDTATGHVTRTRQETVVDMAQDKILDAMAPNNVSSSTHRIFYVAGLPLKPNYPEIGDVVETPSGTQHRVDAVETDQYKASFTLYAQKETWH